MRLQVCTLLGVTVLAVSCPEFAFAKGDLRIEAQVGWERTVQNIDAVKIYDQPKNYFVDGKVSAGGVVYGANIGYDVPVAPLVSVGLDAALSGTSANRQTLDGTRLQMNLDIYAGARVTLHALPGLRVYVKAGYATARFRSNPGLWLSGRYAKTGIDEDTVRFNGGVRLGVGLQQSLIGPLYALAEYRYTRSSQQTSRNQIVTGVGLRF